MPVERVAKESNEQQERVRKAGCGESRTSGLEGGKGVSPTYPYLSQYAKQQGISYRTDLRWFRDGAIKGYQAP